MYLGADYEAVKTMDIKDWQALTDAERKSIKERYPTVYINDYTTKTTYEYKNGQLAGQYAIPEKSTSLWSWATQTAEKVVNQVVNTAMDQAKENSTPPASQKTDEKKPAGFTMPEIPNWVLPVGLLVIAGALIVPKMVKRTI